MAKLNMPNEILNDTPADAGPVDQNYKYITQFVNNDLVNRDGSVAMQAQLHLFGDPVNADDAVRKSYVDAIMPVGVMLPFCAGVAPAGHWALCNGASLQAALYPRLYNVLGHNFGGTGGNFYLPNTTGRVPVGVDPNDAAIKTIGMYGGTYALSLPAHNHAMTHNHTIAHTHEHPHTHTVNPASVATTSAGAHSHDVTARNIPTAFSNQELARSAGGTVTNYGTSSDGAHTHDVDIPSTTTSQPSDATTGVPSTGNTGASSAPNTANEGTANAKHYPPFVVIAYIIRID